uniref:L1 transposable element RRM domain-containing protein n=1 Tax=Latimeria chalumnae TaxID=7897 RepID=H3A8K1_LATCH
DTATMSSTVVRHTPHQQADLWDRVQDLENRCRCNNIRVLGIPGGAKLGFQVAPQFPMSFLQDCFNLEAGQEFEIEKAHRSLAPKPVQGQRPRPFIARFFRFQDRERVLQLSLEAGSTWWHGEKIMVIPDLSPELAAQRCKFTSARQRCMQLGVHYALQYPAVLRVSVDSQTRRFMDPEDALAFLNTL